MLKTYSNSFYTVDTVAGYAEMAVMRLPNCGYETPLSEQSLGFESVSFQSFLYALQKLQIARIDYKFNGFENLSFEFVPLKFC